MATKPTVLLIERAPPSTVLKQSQPICSETLSTIYIAHYRHVLQVCRRFFRRPEDAEDAAAEVFLKLYRVLHQKDLTLPFRPWISQVAGRHCIDKLRQRKREKSSSLEEIDPDTLPDHLTPSPLAQVLRNDEVRHVRAQLRRLPEKYKAPLALRYCKRMSYLEIARTLNARVSAVKMMIFRAKNSLRRNLQREQVQPN